VIAALLRRLSTICLWPCCAFGVGSVPRHAKIFVPPYRQSLRDIPVRETSPLPAWHRANSCVRVEELCMSCESVERE
jgi:hypothetical protein